MLPMLQNGTCSLVSRFNIDLFSSGAIFIKKKNFWVFLLLANLSKQADKQARRHLLFASLTLSLSLVLLQLSFSIKPSQVKSKSAFFSLSVLFRRLLFICKLYCCGGSGVPKIIRLKSQNDDDDERLQKITSCVGKQPHRLTITGRLAAAFSFFFLFSWGLLSSFKREREIEREINYSIVSSVALLSIFIKSCSKQVQEGRQGGSQAGSLE